ncbi:hypothetical protein SAMN05216429_1221, partial [Marinobacter persicus]
MFAPSQDGFEKMHNKPMKSNMDFPQFSGHASITPQEEKYDAGNDHGEENSAV